MDYTFVGKLNYRDNSVNLYRASVQEIFHGGKTTSPMGLYSYLKEDGYEGFYLGYDVLTKLSELLCNDARLTIYWCVGENQLVRFLCPLRWENDSLLYSDSHFQEIQNIPTNCILFLLREQVK